MSDIVRRGSAFLSQIQMQFVKGATTRQGYWLWLQSLPFLV